MLDTILGLAFGAVLVVALICAPVLALSWELRNGRVIPPFRVERAKHPRWYWLCVVTHAVFLAFMVLVCGALMLAGIVSQISN